MKTRIALALRHNIIIAFMLFLSGGLVFAGLTYNRHLVIQEKLQFIENADDLLQSSLEVRRYEKNFLLYGGKDNYDLMLQYLAQTEEQLDRLNQSGKKSMTFEQLAEVRTVLYDYGRIARRYEAASRQNSSDPESHNRSDLANQLRELGRLFTEDMAAMVHQERIRVNDLLAYQKRAIFYSLGAFIVLALGVAYNLFYKIIRPLSVIETAAQRITEGDVREIPAVAGSREISSLTRALNQMIRELDKKADQLVQREKMAALGTLTSGVAHELNNPLSNISSSTQILLEELREADLDFQRKLLTGIEGQVEKARDIVKSLLEFAREREFEPKPADLTSLVENTLMLVKGEIPAEVGVQVDIPYPIELEVDYRRLTQALMNLILNGVQAMQGAGGVLTVRGYYSPKSENVVLEVADTGTGIAESDLAKIFDPFFTTKEVGSGTGLGLYVTYGIIQKHHGAIAVSSKPGQGTKFILTLPVKQAREARVG